MQTSPAESEQHGGGAGSTLVRWLGRETSGGILLLVAAALALVFANTPLLGAYRWLSELEFGPAAVHAQLSLAQWATDGLLAVFFFLAGLELKQEFTSGSLRNPRVAAVPVIAAVGGMAAPAVIFVIVIANSEPAALHGWAIPTATDIAFALGVLAVFGRGLHPGLRTFLLTLAVVDDLLGITIIAIVYTASISLPPLLGAFASIAAFSLAARMRRPHWWLLLPIAVVAWACMHASGVHATVAGVLLGFAVPATAIRGERTARSHRFAERVRPFSTGIALPVFAFFAAGVTFLGNDSEAGGLAAPVTVAITCGLVAGKLLGVLGTTWLVTRFTGLTLPDTLTVRSLLPISLLAGMGFTVSLLIAELAYPDAAHVQAAKIGVLLGTAVAGVLAGVALSLDARRARR